MLLREMTSSALAHSFKRFAQCAVASLALAGLAACGGGGSSTPAETTPTTPTPTPPEIPVTPASAARACIDPPDDDGGISCAEFPNNADAVEYCSSKSGSELVQQCPRSGSEYRLITECRIGDDTSLFHYNDLHPDISESVCRETGTFRILKPTSPITYAFVASDSTADGRWAWASRFGTSASEAESNARTACGNLLGISSCTTPHPDIDAHTGCWAVAVSGCTIACPIPDVVGIGSGSTRQDAETAAISICGGSTCRIPPGESGNPGVICGTVGR